MMLTPEGRLTARRIQRAREMTLHASLLATMVWLVVAVDVVSPGPLGRMSKAHKGNDFVQFYVMASLANAGRYQALVDEPEFRQAQGSYIITGRGLSYPPVYGPQVSLVLQPLAWFDYQRAYALFVVTSLALIACSSWIFWRYSAELHQWPWTCLAVTAAFPPLGYLILNGQLSAVAVTALALLVLGLSLRSRLLAGIGLGLLGYKSSLFLPALAVCLMAGEWTVAFIGVMVVVLQLIAASSIVGVEVTRGFLRNSMALAANPDVLARKPQMMGSLRTFWGALLPAPIASMAYALTAAGSLGVAAWAWRRTSDPVQRIGLLSIAIALAAPHFYLYDMVIVLPGFAASAGILLRGRSPALLWATYASFLSPLSIPLASVTGIQSVTIALVGWLLSLAAAVGRSDSVAMKDVVKGCRPAAPSSHQR